MSSVYLWDLDHGFAGVILIKKAGDSSKKIKGCWDSIHVVEVQVKFLSTIYRCENYIIIFPVWLLLLFQFIFFSFCATLDLIS